MFGLFAVTALLVFALALTALAREHEVEEINEIDDFEVMMDQEDYHSVAARKKKAKKAPKKAAKKTGKKPKKAGKKKAKAKPLAGKAKGGSGVYKLFPALNGHPVRWSCDPIQYRVNVAHAGDKKSALRDVKGAVSRMSAASGIRFQYLGSTTELCQSASTVTTAHLVIGWHPKSAASFFNGRSGVGGFAPEIITDTAGKERASIKRGCIAMNSASKLRPGFGSAYRTTPGGGYQAYSVRGHVLLHEIGHTMGLDHVNSKAEIMYPVADLSRKPVSLGPGDKRALAFVGKSDCFYIPGGRK
jgi:hypothetical protein